MKGAVIGFAMGGIAALFLFIDIKRPEPITPEQHQIAQLRSDVDYLQKEVEYWMPPLYHNICRRCHR